MSDRDERIRNRAYAIWQAEGSPHGRDAEHWEQAMAEVDAGPVSQADPAPPPTRRPAKRTSATPAAKPRRRKAD